MGESVTKLIRESLEKTERRRKIAALRCLIARPREDLDTVKSVFRAAGDAEEEIAGLAVQALAEMGAAARSLAKDALEDTGRRLLAAIRYLSIQSDDPLCHQIPWGDMLGFPMVWVPPGPFLMGSDKDDDPQAYDRELPQHEVRLPGYWIGRYPVTVAQHRDFVEKGGRDVDERSLKDPDDHPVRYVTWRDALAYCRWLGERTGLPVMLPSEAEWEKAARGTDGQIYPWGDEDPMAELCNFSVNFSFSDTTPVGNYSPEGDSPYECADMAGNVWEWTRSLYKDYPYDPGDGREDLEAGDDVGRVVRGGAFDSTEDFVRCASRYLRYPPDRHDYYGFRVVVSPFSRTE
jgi:formylglycine-generating enzyme required for sulfatase activity